MTNYSVLKRAVPLDEAAERYGTVRCGFMLCPFHADKVPSLKLYGDHFHCFGCGAHGDLIDLTAALLGCSKTDAARRLEADFGSGGFVSSHGLAECKLLEVGASGAETRRIERETARLMEARDG